MTISPTLVVLCGPSHVGKSTFAASLRGAFDVVNSDASRKELAGSFTPAPREDAVWARFEELKRAALARGESCTLDASHMSAAARRHALEGAAGHPKVIVVIDPPLQVVRERAVRSRRVPVGKVERMWRAFQRVKLSVGKLRDEGFGEVWVAGPEGRRRERGHRKERGPAKSGSDHLLCHQRRSGDTVSVRSQQAGAEWDKSRSILARSAYSRLSLSVA